MKAISTDLDWNEQSSVGWYAVATLNTEGDDISIELFLADDVTLAPANFTTKRDLGETVKQLSMAISRGLTVSVPTLNITVRVESVNTCEPEMEDEESCKNGRLLARFGDGSFDSKLQTTQKPDMDCQVITVQVMVGAPFNCASIVLAQIFWFQWLIAYVIYSA